MKYKFLFTLSRLTALALLTACSTAGQDDLSERTKIALRDVGNKLLLINQDSTSLILPVKELNVAEFQLAFNSTLSFEPSVLVNTIKESFVVAQLPKHYRVEVKQCRDGEVAYSYQMSIDDKNTIIPCAGRYLPQDCYLIELKFTKLRVAPKENKKTVIIYVTCITILLGFAVYKRRRKLKSNASNTAYEAIGSFRFYPEENKLIKEAVEINLSKKECEILALFVANPNQIITREELTKKVWEDNGVFVGRSLDTYISKLRKKLKGDTSIKLANIHGVGYKLELTK